MLLPITVTIKAIAVHRGVASYTANYSCWYI